MNLVWRLKACVHVEAQKGRSLWVVKDWAPGTFSWKKQLKPAIIEMLIGDRY